MMSDGVNQRKIEPELFGPLGERPLEETCPANSPNDLFPGSAAFLKGRHVERRRTQWSSVRTLIDRLLRPEERVLYVAHAMQVPTVMQSLSLGYMAYYYHQVLLVMTDSRMFEILLNMRATAPETRVRSYSWKSVRDLRMSFGRLLVMPLKGKKQGWRLRVRGDKKLLKLLLPRIKEKLHQEGAAAALAQPAWHCPECGTESSTRPERCLSCSALFRSPRLAAWLSLAFPGAGLMYAGHPVLATLDFLGELLVFGVFAMALATAAEAAQVIGLIIMGTIFLAMTKFESVHLGHILSTRTRPESHARYAGFRRFAFAGGLVSLLAVTGAVIASGTLQPVLDHDIAVTAADGAWTSNHNRSEWDFFGDDESARAQWTHPSGLSLTLFAYPVSSAAEQAAFEHDFLAEMADQGQVLLTDSVIPGPFEGFRHLLRTEDQNGEPVTSINYFVYDRDGRDIHQIFLAVPTSMQDLAVQAAEDFLAEAEWVEPSAPLP
jgi:hypothetical protein